MNMAALHNDAYHTAKEQGLATLEGIRDEVGGARSG